MSPLALVATLLAGVGGVIVVGLKPLLLSTYVGHFGVDASRASMLTALEMTGALLGTLTVAWAAHRANARRIAMLGLALVCATTAACLWLPPVGPLAVLRFASGVGAGLTAGVMAAAIARMHAPDRIFGAFTVLTLLLAAASFAVSPALAGAFGARGIFVLILITALPGLLTTPWFPTGHGDPRARPAPAANAPLPAAPVHAPASRGRTAGAPLLAVGGTIAFYLAVGGVWPFVHEIGVRSGFDAGRIANVLAASQIAGALGALVPLAVGIRFGRLAPLSVALLTMAAALAALAVAPQSFAAYAVAVLAYMGMWLLFFPYLMGTMAALDASGRLSSLSYAIQSIGFAVGPALAALLVRDGRYEGLLWSGAAAHLAALAMLAVVLTRGPRSVAG